MNSTSTASVTLRDEVIEEEIEQHTYLISVIDTQVATETDIKARISKAMVAFLQLKDIWRSKVLSLKNKIRIFDTNIKAVLLYGAETRRTTVTTTKRIQTFVNSSRKRSHHNYGCDNVHVRCWWSGRSDKDAGDDLATLSATHSTALHHKP